LNGNGKFDSHSLHPTWTYSTPTAKPITVRARVTLTDGVVLNAAVTVTVTA
jgi:acetyltransferase-like isoleucine patch superfamily enzyme